jgi:hypothetical protein
MYKKCTLKKLHKFYFYVISVMQCFPHIFHIVSMHFSCWNNTNPSMNMICVKKTQNLLSYQVWNGILLSQVTFCWGMCSMWYFHMEMDKNIAIYTYTITKHIYTYIHIHKNIHMYVLMYILIVMYQCLEQVKINHIKCLYIY